jgi:hypothetical protein
MSSSGSSCGRRSSTAQSTTRDDQPFTAGAFAVRHGSIVEMDWLIDAARLREVDLTILD